MKKSYIFIILFLFFVILITIIGSSFVDGNVLIDSENDILIVQKNKESYFNVYGYDINNPNIIVNPYGNSPLTALVMFTSNNYSEVNVTIKGKNSYNDIVYMFGKNKYHMIPIYGLYADYDNTVVIKCDGIEKVINIKTDKLPDDFIYEENMILDNFVFYNVNYPYVVDSNAEVRWYLNSNYYGKISILDNSSFIIGSDRYNESNNSVSLYKMNYLGKIYNEYIVNDYYAFNAIYNDNVLVLSDKILFLDIQTGEVIRDYGINNGYDYLGLYENNIVVARDNIFYLLNDYGLEEIEYNKEIIMVDFYNNTNNYKIVSSNRFGNLKKTVTSDEKITLVGYDKLNKLNNISVIGEVDRIQIVNNNDNDMYLILDKFMDKKIYEISKLKYINFYGLDGKYTLYFKIEDKLYKTDYYVEVK